MNSNNSLFCLHCGTPLQFKLQDGRQRQVCPGCGWTYYEQLKVGAAALIEQGEKLLLLRRARPPWQGQWYLPAGYVEVNETPAEAAEREAQEECGLDVQAIEFIDALYFNDDPRGSGLLLVYRVKIIGGEQHLTPEISEIGWFTRDRLPEDIAGAGHQELINRWKAGRV